MRGCTNWKGVSTLYTLLHMLLQPALEKQQPRITEDLIGHYVKTVFTWHHTTVPMLLLNEFASLQAVPKCSKQTSFEFGLMTDIHFRVDYPGIMGQRAG